MTLALNPSESLLVEAAAGHATVVGLTLDQYHDLIRRGLLDDPMLELIDGLIIQKDRSATGEDPMTVGDRHRVSILRAMRFAPQFERLGCYLQSQQPIALPPASEPEPDVSVIRGELEDYLDHPPGPGDVLSVIEVSDASLRRDRTIKRRLYASSAVPQYILANLVNNIVLVHENPVDGVYQQITEYTGQDSIRVAAGNGQWVEIPAALLLP